MIIAEPEVPLSALSGYADVADLLARKSKWGCTLVRELLIKHASEDERSGTTLTLVLLHDRNEKFGVRFTFHRVSGLKIQDTHQVCGLAVRDVRSRGWEGIRFEVYDYENAAITFFCEDVTLTRADAMG